MRTVRGFTLIECLICLGILGLLIFPFMDMTEAVNRAYWKSIHTANLRADVDRVGYRVLALLRSTPTYRIDGGNRGIVLSQGQALIWRDGVLSLAGGGQDLVLARDVTHFSAYRRDGLTTITLALSDPAIDSVEHRSFLVERDGYATRF